MELPNVKLGVISMSNELISVLGYRQVQKDEFQLQTLFVAHHQGRIWVVHCSIKNDTAGFALPENEQSIRPLELIALGFDFLWRDVLAKLQRATNCLYAKWCQLNTDGFRRDR